MSDIDWGWAAQLIAQEVACAVETGINGAVSQRERIATTALTGLLAGNAELNNPGERWWQFPTHAAECAVELADALIAELQKSAEARGES